MSKKRKPKHEPGDIYFSEEMGCQVQINQHGEEEPWEPEPYEMFPDPPKPDSLDDIPRRPDGSVSPFYTLDHDQLERLGQDTPRNRRIRHDGWTIERQKDFIETLAATASISDACRYVGLSRQSANKLYNRSPQFRAACDEALKASVHVLATTAFERAVNGTQAQVWHDGRVVGFKEKHHDRLLMFLLRVRDPLNFAPLGDLGGWQRHRAIEQNEGVGPTLDRLEAAEREWQQAEQEPRQLTAPADYLEQNPPLPSRRGQRPRRGEGLPKRRRPSRRCPPPSKRPRPTPRPCQLRQLHANRSRCPAPPRPRQLRQLHPSRSPCPAPPRPRQLRQLHPRAGRTPPHREPPSPLIVSGR